MSKTPPKSQSDGMGHGTFTDKMKTAVCTPAWLPNAFHSCSLLGHLPLPEFLGFWPNAAHLPSPPRKHSCTYKFHTHKSNRFSLERSGEKKGPEMFLWNHELQIRVISHLKDLAIQTSSPVIHPIAWNSGASPSPCNSSQMSLVAQSLVTTQELPHPSLSFLN